jgi:hypothetical protein
MSQTSLSVERVVARVCQRRCCLVSVSAHSCRDAAMFTTWLVNVALDHARIVTIDRYLWAFRRHPAEGFGVKTTMQVRCASAAFTSYRVNESRHGNALRASCFVLRASWQIAPDK